MNPHDYPTKEQILENPPVLKPEALKELIFWKKNVWRAIRHEEPEIRFMALKKMIKNLNTIMKGEKLYVQFIHGIDTCQYSPQNNTIQINETLSIISSLHELAHHLFGPSEFEACRWSVHMFKSAFPKSFAKLKWKGHMLIKQ